MKRTFIFVTLAVFALFGYGCQDCEVTTTFTPSDTAATPNLVKLVRKNTAADQMVIQAIIYGPTTSTDLYSFSFELVIGDPNIIVAFNGSPTAGDALTVSGGQSVSASAGTSATDRARIIVRVTKQGGGAGNQVTGESATIVELTPNLFAAGATTLTIASSPPPTATDSKGAVIESIVFDTGTGIASASSRGDCGGVW